MIIPVVICAQVRPSITPEAVCTSAEEEGACVCVCLALSWAHVPGVCPTRCKKDREIILGECLCPPSPAVSSASESRLCFPQIPLSSSQVYYLITYMHIHTKSQKHIYLYEILALRLLLGLLTNINFMSIFVLPVVK